MQSQEQVPRRSVRLGGLTEADGGWGRGQEGKELGAHTGASPR